MSDEIKKVTVGFYEEDEGIIVRMIDPFTHEQGTITFDLSCDVFVWKRQVEEEDEEAGGGEYGHLHYNAAKSMFYKDGVFSWEEYGPWHQDEVPWEEGDAPWDKEDLPGHCYTTELDELMSTRDGVRKAVTHGHGCDRGNCVGYFLDHSGMLLKIIGTE